MAVKTKDVIVNIDDFVTDGEYKEFDAKGKSAIRIDGISAENAKNLDFSVTGDSLVISDGYSKIIIKNYKNIKYLKTEYEKIGKKETYDLYDLITNNEIDNDVDITQYNAKKLTVTGTIYNDLIDMRSSGYVPVGTKNVKANKGLTIDGGNGNDSIAGTENNDVIKGGNGDDAIWGDKGNDTITGGSGVNIVGYKKGDGNDVINLTKGEDFTLYLLDVASKDDIKCVYASNKKDVRIYADKENPDEYVTLKNFAAKDVTNNATKKTADTSSVKIHFAGGDTVDLREYYYLTEADKNFTGTWMNDVIDASNYVLYADKKKTVIQTDLNKKGLTLNGGAGDDVIVGSKYSDVIKGGNGNDFMYGSTGNDTITGGNGENTIKYTSLDEINGDKINLTKGENFNLDITEIEGVTLEYAVSGKNLNVTLIKGDDRATLTLMNFGKKDVTNNATKKTADTSSVNIITDSKTIDLRTQLLTELKVKKNYTGSWLSDNINASEYVLYSDKKKTVIQTDYTKKGLTINGGAGDDIITGSNYSDTIKAGTTGNVKITGGFGNDKLYAGTKVGSTTEFIFAKGDGKDVIYSGKGSDILSFEDLSISEIVTGRGTGKASKDLIIKYSENDSVTIKNYFKTNKKGMVIGVNSSVNKISVLEGKFDLFDVVNSGVDGTDGDDLLIGTVNDDVITAGKGNDTLIGGYGADTYKFPYGSGFVDRENNIIVMGYDGVMDTIEFDSTGNDEKIKFIKEKNDLVIWYNRDVDLGNEILSDSNAGKYDYNGTTVYVDFPNKRVFCSTITVKDYFISDNPTINKISFPYLTVPKEYMIIDEFVNYELDLRNSSEEILAWYRQDDGSYNGTNFNDLIYTREGKGESDIVYAGDGNDTVYTFGRNDEIYAGNGDDSIVGSSSNKLLDGGAGNDKIYIANGSNSNKRLTIIGGEGSDTISGYLYASENIVYTNSESGGKDTTAGVVDIVEADTSSSYKNIYYAQSETNIITSKKTSQDTYNAYIDQTTKITDKGGNADVLNIMNTNGKTDGAKSGLHVLFNVSSDYGSSSVIDTVNILDETNLDLWKTNEDYKGIFITKNAIETINSSDGYYITSADIGSLAETVASWLSDNGYSDVNSVLTDEKNEGDINALIAKFDSIEWQQQL